MFPAILTIHVFGLVLWVSGLLVTSLALAQHAQEPSIEGTRTLARLERLLLRGMADPGALLTLLAGVVLLTTNSSYYLRAPWMHMKLSLVVLLIVLHAVVATRAKAFASGRITLTPGRARLLFGATAVVFVLILGTTLLGRVFLT